MKLSRLAIPLICTLTFGACRPTVTRNTSSLIDNLDGVWTYPKEQPGDISVTVVKGMQYHIYDYYDDTGYELSRSGDVWGQEGVYFFPDESSYYSPKFYLENNGEKFFILNRPGYDKYVRDARLESSVWIRVGDKLDKSRPPIRPSIDVLGLPYDDPFEGVDTVR